MALFSRKKKEEVVTTTTAASSRTTDRNLASVLVRTRMTEKSVSLSDQNVYTFLVRRDATKFDVRDAVVAHYKVTPEKIRIVNRAPALRPSGSRNRMVKVAGQKKAYVYLKKGDTINLV